METEIENLLPNNIFLIQSRQSIGILVKGDR